MNPTRLVASLSLVLTLSLAPETRGGPIVYNFDSYSGLQNGYTLTGTITTDGSIGLLASSDFLAWNFTATNGLSTITGSSTDPGASGGGLVVEATATQIILPRLPVDPNLMGFSGTGFGLSYLLDTGSGPPPGFDEYTASAGGTTAWDAIANYPATLSLGGQNNWIIATDVPAPGTLTLGLLGIAGLVSGQLALRRRAISGRPLTTRPAGS